MKHTLFDFKDTDIRHIAVIMDGNGRWAKKKNRPRAFGHIKGARQAKTIIETCASAHLPNLTLYTFSSENWYRPKEEVTFLMRLLSKYLKREKKNLIKNNIRFQCIGSNEQIPAEISEHIQQITNETQSNTGMNLTFALGYGGRQEIVTAIQDIAKKVACGELLPSQIDELTVDTHLSTAQMPDPDLVIRTSGEYRLSNFLPWQTIYSELYFTDVLWPDFDEKHIFEATQWYLNRKRRYGRIQPTAEQRI